MSNEPVAWIVRTFDADKGKTVEAIWDFKPMNTIGCTPLYTHPHSEESVKAKTLTDAEQDACFNRGYKEGARDILNRQAKTLTDEEIYKIAMEVQTGFLPQDDTLAFARAILRKAQEK